jgi:3-keto-disaccharide hydrolase
MRSITFSNRFCIPMCMIAVLFVAGIARGEDKPVWKPLFDGKTLEGWKITNFGGEGDVEASDGKILMDFGSSLTGITYDGEFPKTNYEIRLEAKRVDGNDFFCGMTFPVADSHCSFILGGWGGAVVGLSSIDGNDASQNETTQYKRFETDQWYKIRLRVKPKRIEAWIDGKVWVDQDIVDRKISTRGEVDLSKPFGICAWETRAELRKIQIRELGPGEACQGL